MHDINSHLSRTHIRIKKDSHNTSPVEIYIMKNVVQWFQNMFVIYCSTLIRSLSILSWFLSLILIFAIQFLLFFAAYSSSLRSAYSPCAIQKFSHFQQIFEYAVQFASFTFSERMRTECEWTTRQMLTLNAWMKCSLIANCIIAAGICIKPF